MTATATATPAAPPVRELLGPPYIESERARLHAVNPAGFGAMVIASTASILAFSGLFGAYTEALSTFAAAGLARLLRPLIAGMTSGEYDPARPDGVTGPDAAVAGIAATHDCAVCETAYEPRTSPTARSTRARSARSAAPSTAPSTRPAGTPAGRCRPARRCSFPCPPCAPSEPARTAHSYAWPDAYAWEVPLREKPYPLRKGRA